MSPSFLLKAFTSAEPAILVALQPHALPAGHLGQLVQREEKELPVVADDGDAVARCWRADDRLGACRHVQHLLAFARLGEHLVLWHDEAVAAGRGDDQLSPRLMHKQLDRVVSLLDIDHQTEGLAMAPAPGSLSAPSE